jgi:hypothetical protein
LTDKSELGRRRSPRVTFVMPIMVSEPRANPPVTIEHTHTLAANRYGGLIALRSSVNRGQSLLLINSISRVSKECRVVYLGPIQYNKRQVGVEFVDSETDFWNISFRASGS